MLLDSFFEYMWKKARFISAMTQMIFANVLRFKSLDFSNCKLESIPVDMNDIYHIEELNLSDNSISKIENLDNSSKLKILNLSNNHISKIPTSVASLINLEILNLENNPLPIAEKNKLKWLLPLTRIRY